MSDQNSRPIPLSEAEAQLGARDKLTEAAIALERRFHVVGAEPKVNARLERIEVHDGPPQWEVIVEVEGIRPGSRGNPPPIKGNAVEIAQRQITEEELAEHLTAYVPGHLGFNVTPHEEVKDVRRIISPAIEGQRVPTTVFGTDDRRAFRDTSYPWSTLGRVETNRGMGSGVMIGPRHLLTVSHVIDWTAPAGYAADWVRFIPAYFDGDAPFGEVYANHIYWYVKEDGDGLISDHEAKYDYVVVVLDRKLGKKTGWMGARGYDDAWDNLDVWSHVGYPGDMNNGQRPTWQGSFPIDGTDAPAQSILHKADVYPGQSGGPIFGFWEGDVGPRAVAVQSWHNPHNNGASGSMDMRDLVALARTEFA